MYLLMISIRFLTPTTPHWQRTDGANHDLTSRCGGFGAPSRLTQGRKVDRVRLWSPYAAARFAPTPP